MNYEIILNEAELQKCYQFANKSAKTQQAIEFGNHDTAMRPESEISRDNLIGKIAEVAFQTLLKMHFDILIDLDFQCYDRGVWDDQDAIINGWRIDVKGTRQGGKWMLLEWNKLNFRQRENKLAHAYIMFSVGWDRVKDKPTGSAYFEGSTYISHLNPEKYPEVQIFKEGDLLPGTKTRLQAYNYGIQFINLYKNLEKTISTMKAGTPSPKITESFINPVEKYLTDNK